MQPQNSILTPRSFVRITFLSFNIPGRNVCEVHAYPKCKASTVSLLQEAVLLRYTIYVISLVRSSVPLVLFTMLGSAWLWLYKRHLER